MANDICRMVWRKQGGGFTGFPEKGNWLNLSLEKHSCPMIMERQVPSAWGLPFPVMDGVGTSCVRGFSMDRSVAPRPTHSRSNQGARTNGIDFARE